MPDTLDLRTLNRTLLERQGLLRRWSISPLAAIERLVGMQAQEPNDPYVGLWSRLDPFDPDELGRLLLERRAVRIAVMRTTIHLVSADDCVRLWPFTRQLSHRTFGNTGFARAIRGVDVDEVLELGRRLLEREPMTPKQLGLELAERWPDRDPISLAMVVRYGLPLVQVPPRGVWGRTMRTTNTTASAWLGRDVEAASDVEEIVSRYLAAYGPATVADVRAWSGVSGLREVVERMRRRLRTYRDEDGRELFDVPDARIADAGTPVPPRFLPVYDNAVLGLGDRRRIVSDENRRRTDGYLRGLLIDGFLQGTWQLDAGRSGALLRIRTVRGLTAAERDDVAEEGRRLGAFLAPGAGAPRVEFAEGGPRG